MNHPVRTGLIAGILYTLISLFSISSGVLFEKIIGDFSIGFAAGNMAYYIADYLQRRFDIKCDLRKKIIVYRSFCPMCGRSVRTNPDTIKQIKEVIEREYAESSRHWLNNFFNRFLLIAGFFFYDFTLLELMKNGWSFWNVLIEPALFAVSLGIVGGYLLERLTRFKYTEFNY